MKTQQEFNEVALAIYFEDTPQANAYRKLYGGVGERLKDLDKEKAELALELAQNRLQEFFK